MSSVDVGSGSPLWAAREKSEMSGPIARIGWIGFLVLVVLPAVGQLVAHHVSHA
jgi:hypothetical protein